MRIKILRLIIGAAFIVIILNLVYIQIFKGNYYFRLSKSNRIRVVPFEGWRGKILDRNGVILADNKTSFNVLITPQEIVDKKKIFNFLDDVLDQQSGTTEKIFNRKKNTPFAPVLVAQDITREQAFVLEENRYQFPSLMVNEGFRRYYPKGAAFAHVVGYVGKTDIRKAEQLKEYGYSPSSTSGKTGIEEFYDTYLSGVDGGMQIEVNSRGNQVRLLSLKEPDRGENVHLTLDSSMQTIAHEIMDDRPGVIIAMDMETGEILSMVSSPSFDPNIFTDHRLSKRSRHVLIDEQAPLLNRTIHAEYPPGSVFKIPVAIAMLSNKHSINTTFECSGYMELGGIRFGCAHIHGNQNLIEAIAHSCNVYFYRLGLMLGKDEIVKYAEMFGLNEETHIDLAHEDKGHLPSRKQSFLASQRRRWFKGDTLNLSIGQGTTLTTPLQLVNMVNIVALEGRVVQPHLLYAVEGKQVDDFPPVKNIKLPDNIYKNIKQGMRATVADYSGTANVLNLSQIYVAGKTGTAQSTKEKEDHAWFVGYAKGEKRNISFCVFLEHGGSSRNACLIARQLLLELYEKQLI